MQFYPWTLLKIQPMNNKIQSFVNNYKAAAEEARKKYGINPIVILAQSATETGWGTSIACLKRNNFFGMIAAGTPNEYWDGEKHHNPDGLVMRVYKCPA